MNDDAAHDEPMNVDAPATPPEPALYWTACFLVSQCFGSQAEGGWWFNQGELVTTPVRVAISDPCFAHKHDSEIEWRKTAAFAVFQY